MKKKLRMTHQREIILQELCKCTTHPAADELYQLVKKKLPRISLATVYRNLEILAEAGAIKKIEITGRQKRFDWETQQHNHVYCIQCHRIDNILLEHGGEILRPEEDRGYTITGCRIEFTGLCPACQKMLHEQGGADSLSDLQCKVLKALAGRGGASDSKEVAASSGLDATAVSSQLTALKEKGYVASPAPGKYEITQEGNQAIA